MSQAAASSAPARNAPAQNGAAGLGVRTVASQLMGSPTVRSAIEQIRREVETTAAKLTDVRGPIDEKARETFESFMKRAADVRGRALLYPYLGSGIGNGALVELMDGSVKWDMISGIGVHFFGHSDPDMVATAVEGALSDTVQHGNLQANWEAYEFVEAFLKQAQRSSKLKYLYPSTSGAMANENALKVCYQKNAPASRVIAFKDCFMGRSITMSQIGDSAANRVGLPLTTLVDYMPFYDPVAAEAMGKKKYIDGAVKQLLTYVERYPKGHACFIFEMVQGEGGFNVGDRDFFKALMDVCKAHRIAVWDDEIQTWGRLPRMFAYEYFDLGDYVDVFCVGKMTQVCATAYTEEYNPGPGLLSGTFTSTNVAFKVGTRVVERLANGGYYGDNGSIARHHALFRKHVKELAAKHPDWFPPVDPPDMTPDIAGGLGGMMRFTPFGGKKDRITKACKHLFDAGVIAFYAGHGPYHIRVLPPLGVFKEEQWPKVFACIERGLAAAAAEG